MHITEAGMDNARGDMNIAIGDVIIAQQHVNTAEEVGTLHGWHANIAEWIGVLQNRIT